MSKKSIEFDQEEYVARMVTAGMPEEQARTQALFLAEHQQELVREWLATKSDLRRMDSRLTRDITSMGANVIFRLGSLVFLGFMAMLLAPWLKRLLGGE